MVYHYISKRLLEILGCISWPEYVEYFHLACVFEQLRPLLHYTMYMPLGLAILSSDGLSVSLLDLSAQKLFDNFVLCLSPFLNTLSKSTYASNVILFFKIHS